MYNLTKILIVEDETITSMHLEAGLRSRKYSFIRTTTTGEAAIELSREEHPDIIIMDYSLAGKINGVETAAVIDTFCKPHYIFISGYLDDDFMKQTEIFKSSDYLNKPFTISDLIIKINDWREKSFGTQLDLSF